MPISPRFRPFLLAAALAGAAAPLVARTLAAQQPDSVAAYIRANYEKREVRIPMRDGARLFTVLYLPKRATGPMPILLNRTPYAVGPYGEGQFKTAIGPSERFAYANYIVAYQDVRGRYMSEGTFVNMTPHKATKGPRDVDESTDTYDTIDWLVRNVPNTNGRVGTWGISYPGFYTAAGMIDAHPAHRAASPQAPIADWFTGDDFHRNGALWLPHFFRFISAFGKPRPEPTTVAATGFRFPTPDGYDFYLRAMGPVGTANAKFLKDSVAFWTEALQHPNYDAFWQVRNIRPHLKGIRPKVMTVGGFFDAENLHGALEVYRSVERQDPAADNTIVMGPWFHGGWARSDGQRLGDAWFRERTSVFYRDSIEFPFFEFALRDVGRDPRAEALMFDSGRNEWRRFDRWPAATGGHVHLWLGPGGVASFADPAPAARTSFTRWVSDPAKPVPFTAAIAQGMTREYMTEDQRFAASRPDVLVFATEPLAEDVTLAGPIMADLTVATSGTDADLVVKVIDVFPDDAANEPGDRAQWARGGYQMLVRGEPLRARFRESLSTPKPFVPDRPTVVKWRLNDAFHTFRKGHRIMVRVQATWFPLMDRNPQT